MSLSNRPVLVGTSRVLALVLVVAGCERSESDHVRAEHAAPHSASEQHALGAFVVESGKLAVCDPGYGPPEAGESSWLHGLVRNAKLGEWRAFVTKVDAGEWGNRCSELTAHHVDHRPGADATWQRASGGIVVDSGQAGVFELRTMGLNSVVPQGYFGKDGPLVPDKLWYSMCCKLTLGDLGAGVIPGGAVSGSGFGDGAYEWFFRTSADGSVVAVRIVFLTEEDWK
jgi:hypothetical protein